VLFDVSGFIDAQNIHHWFREQEKRKKDWSWSYFLNYCIEVDLETPVCKLYLLFLLANAAQEKEQREEITAAHWCFKVCIPCVIVAVRQAFYSSLFTLNDGN
jgi:hypothetical protein